ncbi:MAG TPA: hypothetical protein PKY50_08070 [Candidatus Competibacter sp.]|nr:hypothetical protein [Candidatus Competibacter sp.]
MNDATEFESSLAGTIDFFQNLRRKLGELETETGAQHELSRTVAASVAALQQDRHADRQTLATLANACEAQTAQLAKLQTDARLLDEHLTQVETLATCLQQDQQLARQTLATLADDLQTQSTTLRQELESALEQQTAPAAHVVALEERLADQARTLQDALRSFQAYDQERDAIRDRMTALESQLAHLDQNARSLVRALAGLQTDIEQHDRMLDAFNQIADASKAIEPQLQAQQTRLDEFAESSVAAQQDLQTIRQDLAHLTAEFETQRDALADAGQARLDLQRHQDRLKYLETLLNKVSADTSSTRQILNVLQSDLATQSDTLRELDQTWRDGLAAYQDRLSHLETIAASAGLPAPTAADDADPTAAVEPFASPAIADETVALQSTIPAVEERLGELATTVATTREEQQELREDLSVFRDDLANLQEYITNLRNTLAEKLQTQQQHFGELATTVDDLRQASAPKAEIDLQPLHDAVATQAGALDELQTSIRQQLYAQHRRLEEFETVVGNLPQTPAHATEIDLQPLHDALSTQAENLDALQASIQQQLHAQQQRLDELETALGNLSRAPAPAEIDLQPLHDALTDHAEALDTLGQTTQQQIAALTATLENQRLESRNIADQIGDIQQEIQQIQQQGAASPVVEQHPNFEIDDSREQELQQNLEVLQEAVTALETRLTGQAQAFSGNFEQFQSLRTDIQDIQHQLEKLESPRRLSLLEQGLSVQEQEIATLKDAVEETKADSQQLGEIVRQKDHASIVAALEARLDEQHEHLTGLSATVEAIRTDSKLTQEKVLTMAANVAQRIHEFQNQLLAAKTAQGEQLQEVEQKLILLQAAVETMETQRKPRRWFSMPATFTTILFTVGAALLAVLAQTIWTAN